MKKKRLTLQKFGKMYIEIRRLHNPEYQMGKLDGRYIHALWLELKKEYGNIPKQKGSIIKALKKQKPREEK